MDDPTKAPMPEGGWSTKIVELQNARIYPPEISHLRQPAGVAHANGDYCPEGALWRGWHPITTEPETPTPTAELKGRWLWGGMLWVHFGHFLAESTNRLWALDHIKTVPHCARPHQRRLPPQPLWQTDGGAGRQPSHAACHGWGCVCLRRHCHDLFRQQFQRCGVLC